MNHGSAAQGRAARLLLAGAAFGMLAACGGGGGGTTTAGGGIGGTGLATGSVSGFGSVFVNGVEYLTTAATVRKRLDDGPGNVAGLDNEVFRAGMIVRVRHGLADNNAAEIVFQDDREGPASNVAAGSLTVMGQTVLFGAGTAIEFSGGTGPGIATNDIVEVSGLADATGAIRATYLHVRPPGSKTIFEIKGTVSGLGGTAPNQSFLIDGVAVVTDGLTILKDLPAGLSDGLFVEVKTADASGPLRAITVESRQSIADDVATAAQASVEGFVTGLSVAGSELTFRLAGVPVSASTATPGAGFVAPNAHIQAEGAVVGATLRATSIAPRP